MDALWSSLRPTLRLARAYLKTLPTLIIFPLAKLIGTFAPESVLDRVTQIMTHEVGRDH